MLYSSVKPSLPRTLQPRLFRVTGSEDVALFVLQYRPPEIFDRLKNLQQGIRVVETEFGYRLSREPPPDSEPGTQLELNDEKIKKEPLFFQTLECNSSTADTIVATAAATDSEDDRELTEISQLLQAIEDKQDELCDLERQWAELVNTWKSHLGSLCERTSILAQEMEQDDQEFEDQKAKLAAALHENEALQQSEYQRKQQKLKELREALVKSRLTLEDLRGENQKLNDNLERYREAMQRIGARKRRRSGD